jgi:pepF/M3 family oligoendopeptidase
MNNNPPPHWNLTNVYRSLDSNEFLSAFQEYQKQIQDLDKSFTEKVNQVGSGSSPDQLEFVLNDLIDRYNEILKPGGTIGAYIHSFVTTDSFNKQAKKLLSEFEQARIPLDKVRVAFESWIGTLVDVLPDVLLHPGSTQQHAFFLKETVEQSRYLMSGPEEALAAELNLSGASAWGKLQGTVTSQLSVDFEIDGKTQKIPMPALINLRGHPDSEVRKRAYQVELATWKTVEEPLASAMNGIKGTVNTLNRHRGRTDALHSALDDARIDRDTLDVLLGAVKSSLPMFRDYFKAKARKLNLEKLAWWDLFAPLGSSEKVYSFNEAKDFILENFATFSPELAEFAKRAFEHNWIDAEQRVGKRGGAFCMSLPAVKESRVLCNFDGSLDQVSTIAHELGHAYHNECMFKAGKTELQRNTPMTMAETASIMCETIVVEAALNQVSNSQEELAILEASLSGAAQIVVDIYSRFLFEKELFERRLQAELSADDLCEMMENAQKIAYGDGVDERYLHKYMWTWKPHYYSAGLSFYNFPYTFGLLFGTGLYALFQQQGAAFIPAYTNLLSSTGEGMAAELAERFGINIRKPDFWESSLAIIGKRIERYKTIA